MKRTKNRTKFITSFKNKHMNRLILPILLVCYLGTATAQVDKDVLNWYNNHKVGMGTDKALKSLKKKTPDTVIVAVIDSGIDIEHENLQGKIWTNKKEIPGNGIDDDENGYVDDVHGWNYLGNADGENQGPARLESARILAKLRDKFEDVESEDDVKEEDKADYELYLEIKEKIDSERENYENIKMQMNQYKAMIPMIPSIVGEMIGNEDYTEKDLKKWKPDSRDGKQMKRMALAVLSGELSEEVIDEQIEQIQSMIDHHFNPDYDDRSLIGDDYLDMTDLGYGNGDVQGPDALHGTHVGGIIGGIRGNDLGNDGVAPNVLLMSLRAVPDGDEFDKDVALAIRYAVDNGANIINASFGKAYCQLPDALYEAIRYAEENDVLFVHAAGNSGQDLHEFPNYPANMFPGQEKPFTHYLSVGASTREHDEKLAANFSNYGKTRVDLFAPGAEIYSTVPNNEYQTQQGTSMAAPMVSGVAAIIKGYFPSLTMKEVRDIIVESVTDFSNTSQVKPGQRGFNDKNLKYVKFGDLSVTGGVVNVEEAVKLAEQKANNK